MSTLALALLAWLLFNAIVGALALRAAMRRDRAARAWVAQGVESVIGAAERYADAATGPSGLQPR